MMNLAQHIERLLTDHDCVIVPRLGGFLTHYAPARWIEEKGVFTPPTRMAGFNPLLTLNDGLLVQSYMNERGVNFEHASQLVKQEVNKLISDLHTHGSIDLPHIGQLHLTLNNTFKFTPCQQITSADLYGCAEFSISRLSALTSSEKIIPLTPHTSEEQVPAQPPRTRRFNIHFDASFWSNAVAVAAIVILFFAVSVPIRNTEVINGNYAQLLPTEMFGQLENHSLAIHPLVCKESPTKAPVLPQTPIKQEKKQEEKKEEVKPISVPSPMPAPAQASSTTPGHVKESASDVRIYHIIVASVGSKADAEKLAASLVKEGHTRAKAIIGGGKMRVCIDSFANEAEAYQAVNELRQEEAYKNAWVLKMK